MEGWNTGALEYWSAGHSGALAVAFCKQPILRESVMNLTLSIGPLVSLIAGILILIVPRLLNYIVAIYLIIIGLLGLFGAGNYHFK